MNIQVKMSSNQVKSRVAWISDEMSQLKNMNLVVVCIEITFKAMRFNDITGGEIVDRYEKKKKISKSLKNHKIKRSGIRRNNKRD